MKKIASPEKAITLIIVFLFVFIAFSPIYVNSNNTSSINENSFNNNPQINSLSSVSSSNAGHIKDKYSTVFNLSHYWESVDAVYVHGDNMYLGGESHQGTPIFMVYNTSDSTLTNYSKDIPSAFYSIKTISYGDGIMLLGGNCSGGGALEEYNTTTGNFNDLTSELDGDFSTSLNTIAWSGTSFLIGGAGYFTPLFVFYPSDGTLISVGNQIPYYFGSNNIVWTGSGFLMDGGKAGPGSSPGTPPAMGIYYPQSNSFTGLSSSLPSYMGVMWNSAYSNGNVILQASNSSNGNPMIVDFNLSTGDYYNLMNIFPAGLNAYLLGENSQGFYVGGDSSNLKQYLSFYNISSGKNVNMTDDIPGNSVHLSALYSSGNLLYLAYSNRSGDSFIETINILKALAKPLYNSTFTETGLAYGTTWYVNLTNGMNTGSITGSSYTFNLTNGTYNYTVSAPLYKSSPSNGSFLVNGSAQTINITFSPVGPIIKVYSKYSGILYDNMSLNNIFGVYSGWNSTLPKYVNASLDGTNRSLSKPTAAGGTWNLTVPIKNLPEDSYIEVFAHYTNGSILEQHYNFTVVSVPGVLVDLLKYSNELHVYTKQNMTWNNTYFLNVKVELKFPSILGVHIKLPVIGGNYSFIPDVSLDFNMSSKGIVALSAEYSAHLPTLSLGPVGISAHFSITATGKFNTSNYTLKFLDASMKIDVGGSFSVTPQTPLGVNVSGVRIGFTATFSVSPNIALKTIISPTINSSKEFISGLDLMVDKVSALLSLPFTVEASASLTSLASGTLGGTLKVNINFGTGSPLMKGGDITGTIFVKAYFLFASYSHNILGPDTIYKWNATDPSVSSNSSNTVFQLASRYWNITGYNTVLWKNGLFSGTIIHDIYPQTIVSATHSGKSSFFAYTYDNVSRNITKSLELRGFMIQNRSYTSINIPVQKGSISFAPQIISMPNGTILALWDAMPFNETSKNPFNWSYAPVQYAYFNITTGSWSKITNLTDSGISQSIMASNEGKNTNVAVLISSSVLSNYSYLDIYKMNNVNLIHNISINGTGLIVSYNASSSIVVLKFLNDTYGIINVSTGARISLPSISNYTIDQVGIVGNTSSTMFILYRSHTGAILYLYSTINKTLFSHYNLNDSILALTVDNTSAGYILSASTSSSAYIYLMQNDGNLTLLKKFTSAYWSNLGTVITKSGIDVYWLSNYGNVSNPLLNLKLAILKLQKPPVPIMSIHYSAINSKIYVKWVNQNSSIYNTGEYLMEYFNGKPVNNYTIQNITSGNSTFSANDAGTYCFVLAIENTFGKSVDKSNISIYKIIFTETGLPSGTLWYVNLTNGQSLSSSISTISFNEVNGTYSYAIGPNNKIYSASSGSFTVNGSSIKETVTFSKSSFLSTILNTILSIDIYNIIGVIIVIAVVAGAVLAIRKKK